jgi:hypothetical protein
MTEISRSTVDINDYRRNREEMLASWRGLGVREAVHARDYLLNDLPVNGWRIPESRPRTQRALSETTRATVQAPLVCDAGAAMSEYISVRVPEIAYLVVFGVTFTACAVSLYAWVSSGLTFINPYVSLVGALGSATLWLTALFSLRDKGGS